jgi:hypothetical protein
LKKMVRGLTASTDDLEKERLCGRFDGLSLGQVELSACPLREKVKVAGEVSRLRVVPRAGSPTLEVTIDDGTGEAVAVFTGRRRIRGIDHGRGIILEGLARRERNKITLVNPLYTLLP